MVSELTKGKGIFSWKMSGLLYRPMGRSWYSYFPHQVTIVHSSLDLALSSIWYYTIFRYSMVPNKSPSSLNKRSWILGMGYGCHKIRLLISLKSETKRTVLSFFGIRNLGSHHWDRLNFFMTLRSSSRSSSCLNVSSYMRGTGIFSNDMVLYLV